MKTLVTRGVWVTDGSPTEKAKAASPVNRVVCGDRSEWRECDGWFWNREGPTRITGVDGVIGNAPTLAAQGERAGLVSEGSDVVYKGNDFNGVGRSPLVDLRHVCIADGDFKRFPVAGLEDDLTRCFKGRGESVIDPADRYHYPSGWTAAVKVHQAKDLFCAVSRKQRS